MDSIHVLIKNNYKEKKTMKNQNPPKKLSLLKKTVAHLDLEQMDTAKGGIQITLRACTSTYINLTTTVDCETVQV